MSFKTLTLFPKLTLKYKVFRKKKIKTYPSEPNLLQTPSRTKVAECLEYWSGSTKVASSNPRSATIIFNSRVIYLL